MYQSLHSMYAFLPDSHIIRECCIMLQLVMWSFAGFIQQDIVEKILWKILMTYSTFVCCRPAEKAWYQNSWTTSYKCMLAWDNAHTNIHTQAWDSTHKHTHMHAWGGAYKYTQRHTRASSRGIMYTKTFGNAHTLTHKRTHTHAHAHTCMLQNIEIISGIPLIQKVIKSDLIKRFTKVMLIRAVKRV